MLDLRQIQYFVCLYEEGSFTRAARRLNIVQPALSMQIRRLEKRLGVDLFERTPRRVAATPAGESVYRIYCPILLDLRNANQLMMELSGKVSGKIAVGIIPSITNSVLADVLSHFGAKYPDVEIRIDEAYSGTLIDWVLTGDLDVAIVNSTKRTAGISTYPLVEEELLLVERRSAGKGSGPIAFRQLKELGLVLPSRRHGIRMIVNEIAEQQGLQIVPKIEVDALAPTLKLVAEGDLMTVLPAIVARRAAAELPLQTRRIIAPKLTRELVYVYVAHRPLSLAVKSFIDFLSEELRRALGKKARSGGRERRKLVSSSKKLVSSSNMP
jgi:LysR family transcriptional regulator, nitrogen assimilation regulatory protein